MVTSNSRMTSKRANMLTWLLLFESVSVLNGYYLPAKNIPKQLPLGPHVMFGRDRSPLPYLKCVSERSNVDGLKDGDSASPSNFTNLQLGISQLRPFLKIAVPFFKNDETARNSLIGVFALTLLNSGVSVAFSYISRFVFSLSTCLLLMMTPTIFSVINERDFYNALNVRDEPLFYEKIELFFGALLIAVPVSVYYRFLREKLSLYWREALTATVLERYYSDRVFYQIETLREIDNPDQRISEDVRHFTKTSLDFFITLFTSIIDLFSFSAVLYQIYPGLFAAIIAYAGAGSLITTNLGRSLVGLNYERLLKEANFRFALIRTRENAEAIAFYDSDAKKERSALWLLFKDALETQLGIVVAQRNLEVFTTSYRYLVQILPSLIVAPLYFAKKVELGTISQSYGAFNHILGDFSIIINQFEALSAFSAGLTRLNSFLEKIETGGWGDLPPGGSEGQSTADEEGQGQALPARKKPVFTVTVRSQALAAAADTILDVRNLTILTPDASRTLVGAVDDLSTGEAGKTHSDGVSFSLKRGDRVLLVGPSGAGKSSFVRAVSGLWRVGYGEVIWYTNIEREPSAAVDTASHNISDPVSSSAPHDVFFLPQKPYNLLGSLREQIVYPSSLDNITRHDGPGASDHDSLLLQILREVKLGQLAERMGGGDEVKGLSSVKDWSKQLSLGEQQRLAFARVLYNRPAVVFLDEATSALDLDSENAMYHLLGELQATYVSVGHRPSLLRFHDQKLVLSPGQALIADRIDHSAVDGMIEASAMMESTTRDRDEHRANS